MDTFMDKLAQKLTAQEMIKANSAADAEELRQLRGQVKEYNDCLAQMQKTNDEMRAVNDELGRLVSDKIAPEIDRLVDNGVEKLSNAAVDAEGIDALVQEGRERMLRITSAGTEQIQRIADEGASKLEQMANDSAAKLENAKIDTAEIDRLVREGTGRIQQIADESLAKIQEIQAKEADDNSDELKQAVAEKIESANDFVHRECVKVYRNVQAVIVEESGKQTEAVNEAVKTLKGKLGAVMGISIAALLFSIAGVVMQILALI